MCAFVLVQTRLVLVGIGLLHLLLALLSQNERENRLVESRVQNRERLRQLKLVRDFEDLRRLRFGVYNLEALLYDPHLALADVEAVIIDHDRVLGGNADR